MIQIPMFFTKPSPNPKGLSLQGLRDNFIATQQALTSEMAQMLLAGNNEEELKQALMKIFKRLGYE